ncbi:MAG TPA: ABC transporter permease [Prolixibacteraceae bacterium]|nr:ABC transporter permease [Prolixibacteraceae bacterium]HPR85667.1 ABC transporter permease [Prolixibacteraceae bacterium]
MGIISNLQASIRHLKANKVNTAINLTGLTLGLGIVTIVLVFVLNELGYNQSFANRDRIYRVLNFNKADNNVWANTPLIIGQTAKEQFAEVEANVPVFNLWNVEVKKGNEFLEEKSVICTEANFINIFSIKLVQGSISGFDQSKGNIILSESKAKKYFGNESPIGKIIEIKKNGSVSPMEVVAVFEDLPQNSTLNASFIANNKFGVEKLLQSMISTGKAPTEQEINESWYWGNGLFFTNYLLLKEGASAALLETKIHQLALQHADKEDKLDLSLQALNDIYFDSGKIVDNNAGDKGNRSMLYILVSIGLLILIMACINYMNLSSAQAISQTKSLAVRKVCGASSKSLILQMMFESAFISLIALPFALIIAHISFPLISSLLGKTYTLSLTSQFFRSFVILVVVAIGTGALSGVLVALKITSFRLVETLKGKYSDAGNRHFIRKGMIVFQVSVFIVLIAVMFVVQKQVHYAFTRDIGIEKEGLLRIPLGDHNYQLFKQEIRKNPNVLQVSGALWIPPHQGKMYMSIPKVSNKTEMVKINGLFVDYGFAQTMGMKLIAGTDFDESKINSGVLVNESAVQALGLKEAIGEQTAFGQVVGVVKDFNMYSIHEAITPMLIGLNPQMCREIAVKIKTENLQETIAFLKKTWKETSGTTAFDFDFTDDILNQIYESDIRFSKIIGLLTVIAILISSLGLFGLSLLISKQKTKEIGVRKVTGARVGEIVAFLNRDFVIWVSIAFAISTPIAWIVSNKWLENFAYKTSLSWWIFALAGFLALGIALLTVSWQSWKAATRNPVDALRYE